VVEILSASNAPHDRGNKLPAYRLIPSIQEIVLVDSRRALVERHRRLDGMTWETTILTGLEGDLTFTSVHIAVPLVEVHAGVELDSGPDDMADDAPSREPADDQA